MSFIPVHLRHVPLGWRSHSTQTMTLCVKLRDDYSYSKSLSDYQPVDIGENWSFGRTGHSYAFIHQTLMGEV